MVYDIESYPNVFTCAFEDFESDQRWFFEISDRMNQGVEFYNFVMSLNAHDYKMIGFNNLNYDYPIIHHQILLKQGVTTAQDINRLSNWIIHESQGSIEHIVWDNKQLVPQVDIYKIHHLDNRARSAGLKVIEFNMRSPNIMDLPYDPGSTLDNFQTYELGIYNVNDVSETKKFIKYSMPMIEFRQQLTEQYNKNYINFNDTKIGKDTFITLLQDNGIKCFNEQRKPVQTWRNPIHLNQAVFDWITFISPEFKRIKEWFKTQSITETNGVFKDVSATVNGFKFDFGLGGIHGSINNSIIEHDEAYAILDLDVTSYYPSLAIVNKVFPEHLGEHFCEIYKMVKDMRKKYKKGTPENAMLKLALNGVYGDSNNVYSPFYDPLYTMTITINGQLLLCALAEQVMQIPSLKLIQVNTDGLTVRLKREDMVLLKTIGAMWSQWTGLELEENEYSAMYIRDVNNYLAVDLNNNRKRKGAYAHYFDPTNINIGNGDLAWHMNHSARIVPEMAEYMLTDGTFSLDEIIPSHTDIYDFCLRAKVSRPTKLTLEHPDKALSKLDNITRYYISEKCDTTGYLIKVMKPLKGKTEWRRIGIDVGHYVQPCNNIKDAAAPINYQYYIDKVKDLINPLEPLR